MPRDRSIHLHLQSIASSLLLALCVIAWLGGIIVMVYVPAYVMAFQASGNVDDSLATAERLANWLNEGGWRIAVPVLAVCTLGAGLWHAITIVRTFRAKRK